MRLKSSKAAAAVLCASGVLALAGCGGSDLLPDLPTGLDDVPGLPGGGGNDGGNDLGSVSAKYERGTWPRYHLVGPSTQVKGALDAFVQDDDGGATVIDGNGLTAYFTAERSIRDISGDRSYALGRWHSGAVTNASGTGIHPIDGKDGRGYHYVVFNSLESMPVSGDYTCQPQALTGPSRASGNGPAYGSASAGAMSLSFGPGGARVNGSISVSADATGSVAIDTTIGRDPATSADIGAFTSGSYGASVQMAEAEAGGFAVVGSYRALLSNGGNYIGTFRYLCR